MSTFRNQPLLGPALPIVLLVRLTRPFGVASKVVLGLLAKVQKKRQPTVFAGYTPDEHDVFVATFSKSGTNWIMQIAQQIAYYGKAEFEHIHELAAWAEAPFRGAAPLHDKSVAERAPTGLRLIKTAIDPRYVPYNEAAKYITVLRDPKEIAVSAYYFIPKVLGVADQTTPEHMLNMFLKPGGFGTDLASHIAGSWSRRNHPNRLLLRFDELKKDLPAHIQKIAELMNEKLTPEQFDEVVHKSNFAYMKKHETKFGPPILPLITKSGNVAKMLRSGASGNSQELFTRDQQAAIDKFMIAELKRLDSDFPYQEIFKTE